MAIGIGDIVTVNARIAAAGTTVREFGRTLFVDKEDSAVTEKEKAARLRGVPAYASSDELDKDEPSDTLKEAGSVYFQQSPFPRNLMVGTWIDADQPSFVFGLGDRSTTDIEALGDSVALTLGGVDLTVDLDGQNTLADQATALATGINASSHSSVTVTVVDGAFVVQVPHGTDIGIGFADVTAAQTLGLSGSGVLVLDDPDEETLSEALTRIEGVDASWYFVALHPDIAKVEDDAETVANFVAARRAQAILDFEGDSILTANETASIGAVISALSQDRVGGIYNGDAIDHKGISFSGRFSSINFEAENTLITGKFKQLPGTTPTDDLTAAQRDELDRKRVNWYETVGDGPITAEGKTFGTWIDVQLWLDWFAQALEVAAYNALVTSARVPQTDAGVAAIRDALVGICEQGVRNGGIAAGTVSAQARQAIQNTTGNNDFDGFLSTGYIVHAGTVAEQSQADREARKSPPFNIWVKGSGAIHFVTVEAVLES